MNIDRFQNVNLKNKQRTNHDFLNLKVEDMTFLTLLKNKSASDLRIGNKSGTDGKTDKSFFRSKFDHTKRQVYERKDASVRANRAEDYAIEDTNILNASDHFVAKKECSDSDYKFENADKRVEETLNSFKKYENETDLEQVFDLQKTLESIQNLAQNFKKMEKEFKLGDYLSITEISELFEGVLNLEGADLEGESGLLQASENLEILSQEFATLLENLQSLSDEALINPKEDVRQKLSKILEELKVSSVEVSEMMESELSLNPKDFVEETGIELNESAEENLQENLNGVHEKQDKFDLNAFSKDQKEFVVEDVNVEDLGKDSFKDAFQLANKELKANLILDKIGSNPQKTISSHEIYSQIKEGMSKLDINGNLHEIVIKLKPEELGKVELKLEMYRDFIIAKFDVENQAVKEAIESNLKDLRSSLEQSGYNNMQFDVNVGGGKEGNSETSHFTRSRMKADIELNAELQGLNAGKTLHSMLEETSFEYLA